MVMDGRWARQDVSVKRLLEAIAAPELDYYNAADERALVEAVQRWPLLAAVSRALFAAGARDGRGAGPPDGAAPEPDPILRVVSSDAASPGGDGIEDAGARTGDGAAGKETER